MVEEGGGGGGVRGGGGKEHNSTLGGSAGQGLKCPRILYINLSDKMACVDSEDPDQMFLRSSVKSGSILFNFTPSILWNK